jgi:hypothetical protein
MLLRRRAARTGASRDLWRWRGFQTQSLSRPYRIPKYRNANLHTNTLQYACAKSASSASHRWRVLHEGIVIITINPQPQE